MVDSWRRLSWPTKRKSLPIIGMASSPPERRRTKRRRREAKKVGRTDRRRSHLVQRRHYERGGGPMVRNAKQSQLAPASNLRPHKSRWGKPAYAYEVGRGRPTYEETLDSVSTNTTDGQGLLCETKPIGRHGSVPSGSRLRRFVVCP